DPATILGDVVISIDTALAQARLQGVTARARLRTLLIHGVLHLIGYDHERSPGDARRMFVREREIAAALAASHRRSVRR
ncbi:MAG: rRNA maturation RNase YbeY, partial [Candidatus Binataceae bacterium]